MINCYMKNNKIMSFLKKVYYTSSSVRYIEFLKKQGVEIGSGCIFRAPKTTIIDMTRPYLISIGNNVDMNVNFKICTHDWGARVFIGKYNQMINSSGKVTIGSNIYFGADCMVLKGVTIGDNCIIGAGSIVSKSIPSNSVALGNPCRVVCSLEEYYQKRLKKAPMEAAELVNAFYERKRHYPLPNELTEEEIYYKSDSTFGGRFNSFDEFIEWCKQQKK